MAEWSKAIDC